MVDEHEQWLPIQGYPGYEVSDHGKIRSERYCSIPGCTKFKQLITNAHGYLHVQVFKNKKPKNLTVASLVASHFMPSPGYMMKEWTAVSPKVYSAIADTRDKENHNTKKIKGVSKAAVKKQITHQDFNTTIATNNVIKRNVTRIGSVKHNVYTIQSEKIALTSFFMIRCI